MMRNVIRYRTKPGRADENQALVDAVFTELNAAAPDGVRYLALRLADDTFIHLVTVEREDGANPIPGLAAFRAFQAGIKDRCIEPPQSSEATIIGNYRALEMD